MLLGALVADAACLGLHWIYEPERIEQISTRQGGECAFLPVDAANYEGVRGYFAHGGRSVGMLTQYGETLRLAIQSMNAAGGDFDVAAYQAAFVAHFGAGGTYQGYIDRVTRGALDSIANEQSPSGIDDDQNPAIARLPAIVARYRNDDSLPEMLLQSMQVTNVNDVAEAYSNAFANVLTGVMRNEPLNDVLEASAASASDLISADIQRAMSTTDANSTDFAGEMGRACHLPTAGPIVFHILKHSASYREAVERNILAGGDSAGRSILMGAVMAHVHGVATETGIPLSWALQMKDAPNLWKECKALSAALA
jgi:ADP-ribosylglycohydrolase